MRNHSTAKLLRHFLDASKKGRNRLAVGESTKFSTQGSRSGNPGLKAATALRFATKTNRAKSVSNSTQEHQVLQGV